MALPVRTIAYGGVAVLGIVLVMLGTPRDGTSELASVAMPAPRPAPTALIASGNGVSLRSVNFDFPDSDRGFPGGDAAQTTIDNCTACHSPGMILNQPALTADQWRAEVDHMRRDFKAPVAADDVAAIVAYLTAIKGAK
jgi:hypothetical protein